MTSVALAVEMAMIKDAGDAFQDAKSLCDSCVRLRPSTQ